MNGAVAPDQLTAHYFSRAIEVVTAVAADPGLAVQAMLRVAAEPAPADSDGWVPTAKEQGDLLVVTLAEVAAEAFRHVALRDNRPVEDVIASFATAIRERFGEAP